MAFKVTSPNIFRLTPFRLFLKKKKKKKTPFRLIEKSKRMNFLVKKSISNNCRQRRNQNFELGGAILLLAVCSGSNL